MFVDLGQFLKIFPAGYKAISLIVNSKRKNMELSELTDTDYKKIWISIDRSKRNGILIDYIDIHLYQFWNTWYNNMCIMYNKVSQKMLVRTFYVDIF